MIAISQVEITEEHEQLVLSVLRSGQLAQGQVVAEFEQCFAETHGVAHAVAVSNGTVALIAALRAHGIGPGDEVITTPFTFTATMNAILDVGATPRFADVGEDFNICPKAVEALISPRTRAIMPVHLYGLPCDMSALGAIAEEHSLLIVEDAAQAVGATIDGKHVGSFGTGCFSLYATKNLTTGEGGVVTTDDDELADRLRLMRNQGMRRKYEYEIIGTNYRLTDLAAAVGLPSLRRLDEISERRANNAATLREQLGGIGGLVVPPEPPRGVRHVYHQFTVRVTDDAPIDRDELATSLASHGVSAGVYYPRLAFDYPCYDGTYPREDADVPIARRATEEVLSLPVHPLLDPADLDHVASAVKASLA